MIKNAKQYFQKLLSGYYYVAVTLLNILLALTLLNVFLSFMFMVKDSFSSVSPVPARTNHVVKRYGKSTVSSAYPLLNESVLEVLLHETWSRSLIYDSFTQFKEAPYHGSYVNVDAAGFRVIKNQGPWPPESKSLNIFLFGGSTTFGYGVMDNQTVPSYLQEYLTTMLDRDVHVYNFGQGNYFSTQERILFEKLLLSGFVPDAAIFIDGLNDFYFNNEPRHTDQLHEYMAGRTPKKSNPRELINGLISKTSLGRTAQSLKRRLFQFPSEQQQKEELNEAHGNTKDYADKQVTTAVIERYLRNKELIEAISKSQGVIPIFVWQPVPTYKYDQSYHPFSRFGYGQHTYSQYGYPVMANVHKKNLFGRNFLWCADIQEDKKKLLYVDKVHYSSKFSREFARVIAELIKKRSLFKALP